MARPRDIDMELVDAYLARRALDYLVGFTLSPVLWRKLPAPSRPAGCSRWRCAWSSIASSRSRPSALRNTGRWRSGQRRRRALPARLVTLDRKRLGKFDLPDEASAQRAKKAVQMGDFSSRRSRPSPRAARPPPPFTTSTLQQEASRKLGFNATRTMQAAQRLYEGVGEEGGLITYMRTDGVQVTPEALNETRAFIGKRYGAATTSPTARASTRPRPRTPRKRTRRSARPRSTAIRPRCGSSPTSSGCTS
jgi:DNA topoisomerase-1